MCFIVCHEIRCATDELGESWSMEYELTEKHYLQPVKSRSIDPGDKILQIFAYTDENEFSEGGKD